MAELVIPYDAVCLVVDALLNEILLHREWNWYESPDVFERRELDRQQCMAISRVNRDFRAAFLRFFAQSATSLEFGYGWQILWRRQGTSSTLRLPMGLVKLLALRGKLSRLERVHFSDVGLERYRGDSDSEQAGSDGTPLEHLFYFLQPLFLDEDGEEEEGRGTIADRSSFPPSEALPLLNRDQLSLKGAHIELQYIRSNSTKDRRVDRVLGLNASNTEVHYDCFSLCSPVPFTVPGISPPRTTYRGTLSEQRSNSLERPIQCRYESITSVFVSAAIVFWTSDYDNDPNLHWENMQPFPSHQWSSLLLYLVATCGSLRQIRVKFAFNVYQFDHEESVGEVLDVTHRAVLGWSEQVLLSPSYPAIVESPVGIEVEIEQSYYSIMGERVLNHPIFQLGKPKAVLEHQQRERDDDNGDDATAADDSPPDCHRVNDLVDTIVHHREIVVVEGDSGGGGGGEGSSGDGHIPGRKAISWHIKEWVRRVGR